MGKLTVSMAMFKFANCECLPGRVKHRELCRSRLTPRSSDPRTRAQFRSLIDTWWANGQAKRRSANRSTTKKASCFIPWLSLHDVTKVTKGQKSSAIFFLCLYKCILCLSALLNNSYESKHHLIGTEGGQKWGHPVRSVARLADLLVAKLFGCKQPHLGLGRAPRYPRKKRIPSNTPTLQPVDPMRTFRL